LGEDSRPAQCDYSGWHIFLSKISAARLPAVSREVAEKPQATYPRALRWNWCSKPGVAAGLCRYSDTDTGTRGSTPRSSAGGGTCIIVGILPHFQMTILNKLITKVNSFYIKIAMRRGVFGRRLASGAKSADTSAHEH